MCGGGGGLDPLHLRALVEAEDLRRLLGGVAARRSGRLALLGEDGVQGRCARVCAWGRGEGGRRIRSEGARACDGGPPDDIGVLMIVRSRVRLRVRVEKWWQEHGRGPPVTCCRG